MCGTFCTNCNRDNEEDCVGCSTNKTNTNYSCCFQSPCRRPRQQWLHFLSMALFLPSANLRRRRLAQLVIFSCVYFNILFRVTSCCWTYLHVNANQMSSRCQKKNTRLRPRECLLSKHQPDFAEKLKKLMCENDTAQFYGAHETDLPFWFVCTCSVYLCAAQCADA